MRSVIKYRALRDWLLEQESDRITVSLADIENILSFNLPKSAREHQAWWANQNPPSSQSLAWTSAGWRAFPNLRTQTVRFERANRVTSDNVSKRVFYPRNPSANLSEDHVKTLLCEHLKREGWHVQAAMGKSRGIDIEARRSSKRWIIEAKGSGSLNPMRVNYFLAVLGETLQRMDNPETKYSIALPDLPQFRGLWSRLPRLAKERTKISCLLVRENGEFDEIR